MARLSSRFVSDIYQEFISLRSREASEVIRFYEENKSAIDNLELNEFFELQVSYLIALFQFNEFEKFLVLADEAIEASIIHSIKELNGEEIYQKLLWMKGKALHYTMHYDRASFIFEELIKIDAFNDKYYSALARSKSKNLPAYIKNSRALSILLFIASALIIGIEFLIIKSLYPEFELKIQILRNIIFGLGWLVLICGELYHFFRIEKAVLSMKRKLQKAKGLSK